MGTYLCKRSKSFFAMRALLALYCRKSSYSHQSENPEEKSEKEPAGTIPILLGCIGTAVMWHCRNNVPKRMNSQFCHALVFRTEFPPHEFSPSNLPIP